MHNDFPNDTFLELSITGYTQDVELRVSFADHGETLGYRQSLTQGTGGNLHTRQKRSGVAVQNAFNRSGVHQEGRVKVTEVRINRSHGCHGVSLTKDKHILAYPGRILYIQVQESTVKQGHERNRGRKRSTYMDTPIHGLITLLQGRYPDIRILDFKQLAKPSFQQIILGLMQS
jgi:hypothetical protein